ncbi:hypothetical protein C6497_12045 [Candidatus Poribacteria bacterium]|nr:MAG: hypothetical protein C6497_12045 [Candidatus Poribacteria bacterium]
MKITQIEVIRVRVPYHDGIYDLMTSRNLYQIDHVFKVHTDEGIIGIGDGSFQSEETIQQYIGKNPFDYMNGWAPTPLQQAFYDIMGKSLGVPVHQLLGVKHNDKASFGYWSIDMTPQEWAAEAQHAYKLGYRLHKIKARPWFEVLEQVQAISDVVPDDFQLRVDANDSFETAESTLEVARQLKDFNIESFETPIPQSNIEGYKEIKAQTDMPITIHFGNPDPVEAIRAKMNDSFIIAYPDSRAANAIREGTISHAAHLPVWIQIVGLGITTAYVMHLTAVIPNATMPSITLNALRAFDIVTPSTIPLEEGHATIPDKPGLGVELDEDAIDNCRE